MRRTERGAGLSRLCNLLGYTRQAFYKHGWYLAKEALEADLVVREVLRHRALQPNVGTRKLMLMMRDFTTAHGIGMGRDALFSVLRDHGLLIRKRRRKAVTTFSRHWLKKYPNLIRGYVPQRANMLFLSDITYISLPDGFAYLSLVTDGYSRRVMGFCLHPTLEARGTLEALRMALRQCCDMQQGMIHHSDRGVQYCSHEYVDELLGRGIAISMTENGDPLENAVAERVNGIFKDELLKARYASFEEARAAVAGAVGVYNGLRPHGSCDMMTPDSAHAMEGPLRRHWKNYRKYGRKDVP